LSFNELDGDEEGDYGVTSLEFSGNIIFSFGASAFTGTFLGGSRDGEGKSIEYITVN